MSLESMRAANAELEAQYDEAEAHNARLEVRIAELEAERDRLLYAVREIKGAGGYGATQQIAEDALAELSRGLPIR